ncbi:GTP-binding protein Di-Ras1 [Manis javanica]|nr:GTP-binding protein Di-Ras1 [Manis javanica]
MKRLWLRALEAVQKEVWASIKEAYQPEDLSVPHQFQGYVTPPEGRHLAKNIEGKRKKRRTNCLLSNLKQNQNNKTQMYGVTTGKTKCAQHYHLSMQRMVYSGKGIKAAISVTESALGTAPNFLLRIHVLLGRLCPPTSAAGVQKRYFGVMNLISKCLAFAILDDLKLAEKERVHT